MEKKYWENLIKIQEKVYSSNNYEILPGIKNFYGDKPPKICNLWILAESWTMPGKKLKKYVKQPKFGDEIIRNVENSMDKLQHEMYLNFNAEMISIVSVKR